MKNILILIIIVLFTACKAQIYPLDYKDDVPTGAYYKDLNGDLDKYVGLWKGNWNGKILYLDLKKVKYQMDDIFRDKILGERKVINNNGQVEIDRITNFNMLHPEFYGIGYNLKNFNIKRLYFYPKNMCGKSATLDITSITTTQMTLHFEYEPSFVDPNCQHNAYVDQYGDYPMNFPKDIVLTKQ